MWFVKSGRLPAPEDPRHPLRGLALPIHQDVRKEEAHYPRSLLAAVLVIPRVEMTQ